MNPKSQQGKLRKSDGSQDEPGTLGAGNRRNHPNADEFGESISDELGNDQDNLVVNAPIGHPLKGSHREWLPKRIGAEIDGESCNRAKDGYAGLGRIVGVHNGRISQSIDFDADSKWIFFNGMLEGLIDAGLIQRKGFWKSGKQKDRYCGVAR